MGLLNMDIGTGTYSYSAVKVITCIENEANFYKIPSHLNERNAREVVLMWILQGLSI
jgi:hypothetical protein